MLLIPPQVVLTSTSTRIDSKRQILTYCMSTKDKLIHFRSEIKLLFRLAIARVTDSSRKTRIVYPSAAVLTLIAFGAAGVAPIATDSNDVQVRAISAELQLPIQNEQIAKLEAQQQLYIAEDKMHAGDTFATSLTRLGVDDKFRFSQENPQY